MASPTIVTVALENRPGTLGEAARLLAKENINIEAVDCNAVAEVGFVRFLTSDPDRTEKILSKQGYSVTTTDLLEVPLANRPGELARVCEALGNADVNILSCFGTNPTGTTSESRILFVVNDVEKARKILREKITKAPVMAR